MKVKLLAGAAACTMTASLWAHGAGAQGRPAAPSSELQPFGAADGLQSATIGDAEFVRRATSVSRFGIEQARLVVDGGEDPQLKELARLLLMEFGRAAADLDTLARAAALPLPAELELEDVYRTRLSAAASGAGAQLDRRFRQDQLLLHEEAIVLLLAYRQSGHSEQLKAWAAKLLPVLQRHREALVSLTAM
jgi:putative membrane protein